MKVSYMNMKWLLNSGCKDNNTFAFTLFYNPYNRSIWWEFDDKIMPHIVVCCLTSCLLETVRRKLVLYFTKTPKLTMLYHYNKSPFEMFQDKIAQGQSAPWKLETVPAPILRILNGIWHHVYAYKLGLLKIN